MQITVDNTNTAPGQSCSVSLMIGLSAKNSQNGKFQHNIVRTDVLSLA